MVTAGLLALLKPLVGPSIGVGVSPVTVNICGLLPEKVTVIVALAVSRPLSVLSTKIW